MKIPQSINFLRRVIMKSLTKNIGKSHYKINHENDIKIKTILISRPNHRLGNLLLITPLVQEVIDTFPDCRIDLFVKGNLAPTIFQNYENIDRIIQLPKKPFSNLFQYIKGWFLIRSRKYDLVVNTSQNSSSGKLSTLFATSTYKFFGEFDQDLNLRYPDYRHAAKNSIYNFRDYLLQLGLAANNNIIPSLDLKLDKKEIKHGGRILNKMVENNKETICLFTNATGVKCYSELWWTVFYEKIKKEFPHCNIIELLPIENISKLGFQIPVFYSEDIREMASLIANTALFIAADSGVMHLACASGTPTIGLFCVTDEKVYEPYNNKSLAINTIKVNNEQIINLIKTNLGVIHLPTL
jgi:heptosyltransferase-3